MYYRERFTFLYNYFHPDCNTHTSRRKIRNMHRNGTRYIHNMIEVKWAKGEQKHANSYEIPIQACRYTLWEAVSNSFLLWGDIPSERNQVRVSNVKPFWNESQCEGRQQNSGPVVVESHLRGLTPLTDYGIYLSLSTVSDELPAQPNQQFLGDSALPDFCLSPLITLIEAYAHSNCSGSDHDRKYIMNIINHM